MPALKLKPKDLVDTLVTAFEGGSNHWVDKIEFPDEFDYTDPGSYKYDYSIVINSTHSLTPQTVQRGWSQLTRIYPARAARILEGQADAEDADVFLQLAVLGDITYS